MSEVALRFGNMAAVYYEVLNEKVPKQMELLDRWFPGLVIKTEASDGETKTPADYVDREYMIHAVSYHGKLYSGESKRVTQILGRLVGTATGNREKERKSAELIQKHVAEQFIQDMELTPRLVANVMEQFDRFSDEQLDTIAQKIFELIFALAGQREALDDYDRKMEAFSMDDEVFDGVLYNAAYQLNLDSYEGLCRAYLWLLTGGLLRNETGRVLRVYDSSFIATRRQISEAGNLLDKLNYIFCPEEYYSTYSGGDLDNRFPGVEWYCDACGDHLNEQVGFDDHLSLWQCRKCGYINEISFDEIYDNDEDTGNQIKRKDSQDFADAIERRRQEVKEQKEKDNDQGRSKSQEKDKN